jgi:hypothetical protein
MLHFPFFLKIYYQQYAVGFVFSIGIMIVEMILFITRALRMESEFETKTSATGDALVQLRSGGIITLPLNSVVKDDKEKEILTAIGTSKPAAAIATTAETATLTLEGDKHQAVLSAISNSADDIDDADPDGTWKVIGAPSPKVTVSIQKLTNVPDLASLANKEDANLDPASVVPPVPVNEL